MWCALNRTKAIHDDLVEVRLLPKSEWRGRASILPKVASQRVPMSWQQDRWLPLLLQVMLILHWTSFYLNCLDNSRRALSTGGRSELVLHV